MKWTEVSPGIRISEEGHYASFYCVGCRTSHGAIPIGPNHSLGVHWSWSPETKTLAPSVRHFHYEGGYDEKGQPNGPMVTDCHYNIENGRIFYHPDCTHHTLRGYYDMLPFPESWG